MNRRKKPIVITVASISGGGKTTLTTNLEKKLDSSKSLFFDNYDFKGPIDYIEWIKNDSNPNIWDLTPLINDLEALLEKPLNYIILDFPFAYLHIKTREYIDLAVYIDTPLDIALLRRIKRDFTNGTVEEIISDLDHYQLVTRLGYLNMLKKIKPNSDLIVDGTLPISKITEIIIQTIREIE